MTTRISANGLVRIPAEVRKKLKLRGGENYTMIYSQSGEIRLIPIRRKSHKTLFHAFRALRGLEIPHRSDPIRHVEL